MTTHAPSRLTLPVSERDHIQGPATAAVTLVEYGDYQCPYCGQAYPIVEALREQLGNRLRFVFRHFPLTQMHPHAEPAAEAAEAAGAQGQFWEMHDVLFTHQHALDDPHLIQYAAALDLDPTQFYRALAEHYYTGRVREDFTSGVRSGVNGTPTFFINQARYNGPPDFESLLAVIEDAAEEQKRLSEV
jgi:protein-disulfide isomerase